MHESQRRSLTRVLFVATCILPTIATLLYGFAARTASHRDSLAARLGAACGLRIEIERVRYPRPGGAVLEGVRGLDPETSQTVVECRSIESLSDADGLSLKASGVQIHADLGARLFDTLERHLRNEASVAIGRVGIKADELTWHVGKDSQTLVDFVGLLGQEDNVRQLAMSFRLPEADDAHPTAMRIARDAAAAVPETIVELDSGSASLPCAMFGPLVDTVDVFGAEARWNGRLKMRRTGKGWEGLTSSEATSVDFRQLAAGCVGDRLWGTGEVRIHWAEFNAGRIARLRGTIIAGPGQIQRDLLRAAIVHLGFGDPNAMVPEGPPVLFDRMEFDFVIDADGLTIKSRSAEQHDALLWRDDIVYWHAPPSGAQPTANLLRALAADAEPLVPFAPPTSLLVGKLPLPSTATRAPVAVGEKQPKLWEPRLRLRAPTGDDTQLR